MRKVVVRVSTSKLGSTCIRTFNIEDDEDDTSIEEAAKDTMLEMINWDYEIIED
jgi:hypothetical protein